MALTFTERLADAIPLHVYRQIIRRDVVVFSYHAVSDAPLPHVQHLIPYKTQAEFEQDLIYLKEYFTFVRYEQVLAARTGKGRLPRNAALVTLDDGYAECFSAVRPLLHKHEIPAVFFLITDCIDNRSMAFRNKVSLCIERMGSLAAEEQAKSLEAVNQVFGLGLKSLADFAGWIKPLKLTDCERIDQTCRLLEIDVPAYLAEKKPYLTLEQIESMHKEGFVFGGHTRRHPNLADIPELVAKEEISESCEAVCEVTGQAQAPFAFPFSANRVRREFLADLLQDHRRVGLMFDTKGVQRDKPFILSRITADTREGGAHGTTNMPWLLHQAYKRNLNLFFQRISLDIP